ncbi:MAG: hypothetical protein AB7Q00_11590 [Phycisphaerales bacterium]
MRLNIIVLAAMTLAPLATVTSLTGCEEKKPAVNTPGGTTKKADDHGHDHGPSGEHAAPKAGHGGAVIALGEQTIGSFTAKATRDEGQIVAGKDAPIDVTITPVAGATTKAVAVRFWIGTQDAKGSVKAKAEIEDPKDPNRWHVHAEIPNPMPTGSKLWVEIEDDKGGTAIGSYDLKM